MFKTTLFALAALAGTSVSASPAPKAAPAGELAKKDSQWGTGTFYYQNGNPGNCGWYMGDGDNICAINNAYYDGGSHCGNWVTIKNTNTGAQTACMVADRCPSCNPGSGDIDLSRNVFGQLTNWNYGQGVVDVEWWFQ